MKAHLICITLLVAVVVLLAWKPLLIVYGLLAIAAGLTLTILLRLLLDTYQWMYELVSDILR